MTDTDDIINLLEKRLATFEDQKSSNVGIVEKNQDGVITASGLSKAMMGELVSFDKGNKGLVLNLDEESVSIILLDRAENIKEGDVVKTTGKLLSIPVSENLLGRVINPLGIPLDGKPKVEKGTFMPLERIAAGVIEREPVNTPLKTGIKAIDSMIPIGRGQRELIIGDRGLGKTAIAIDAIINQRPSFIKETSKGKDKTNNQKPITNNQVICVYVAIGQKQSLVAQIANRLQEENAFAYTIIVAATASDAASLQYLAPYSGVGIAEYFMEKGKDVLIVYDDLTKHAWAYRQLALVLGRPAGREAYPGDIFYLHSRLLERAVKLNKENGGGSITALPIIETQADDMSAYIPTNVISITDGQLYLQADLFNAGIRPAINAGSSVSRVGGSAQTGLMKSVAGRLRLELAQFRELAAFAQFGSELDSATLAQLERGKRITEILKQPQYQPLHESQQALILWAATNGFLDDLPIDSCGRFETELYTYVQTNQAKLLEQLSDGSKPSEETIKLMQKTVQEFKKRFSV